MYTRLLFTIMCASLSLFVGGYGATAQLSETLTGDFSPGESFLGAFYGDHSDSDDRWLIVGAPREDIDVDGDGVDPAQGDLDRGAVYIYSRTPTGPVLHTKLIGEGNNKGSSPSPPGDRFGGGVALAGNTLMVAAGNDTDFPGDARDATRIPGQDAFNFAGKVYVYEYNADADEWVKTQKLRSNKPNTMGAFGGRTDSSPIALFTFNGEDNPRIALIGEVENGTGIPGVLHVFKRNDNGVWNRVQGLQSPVERTKDEEPTSFADSIEAIGDLALVLDRENLPGDRGIGRVHVYRVGENGIKSSALQRQPIQTIESPSGISDWVACGAPLDFGQGLSAAGDVVVIGDPCNNDTVVDYTGAIHVYSVDSASSTPLAYEQMIENPSGVPGGQFAVNFGGGRQSIDTDGNLIVVGTALLFAPQQPTQVFARDNGTFVLVDSIPGEPGVPLFQAFGQSVLLMSGDRLAIGHMLPLPGLNGAVHLYDLPDYQNP